MDVIKNKQGKISKVKIGAALIALGPLLVTLGGLIGGNLSLAGGLNQLLLEAGAFLGVCGLRDLPFFNAFKK